VIETNGQVLVEFFKSQSGTLHLRCARGFVTTAAEKGRSLDAIMAQTGHKSVEVVRGYTCCATAFDDNVSGRLV